MVADRLGVPQLTFAADLEIGDDGIRVIRHGDVTMEIFASLPAVVSVTDEIGEARYPTFKNIMAARKKQVLTWSLADLDIGAAAVGLGAAGTAVRKVTPRPPRAAGTVIFDEGDAAIQVADFLASHKLI
jgi:electron transfer flavoprotein beta subunit